MSERRVSLIYRLVCPFLVSTYVKMMVIRYWSSQSILARPSQFISSQLNSTQLKCDVVGNSIYRVRFDSSITTRRDTRSISVITRLKKVYRFDLTEVRFTEIKHNTHPVKVERDPGLREHRSRSTNIHHDTRSHLSYNRTGGRVRLLNLTNQS